MTANPLLSKVLRNILLVLLSFIGLSAHAEWIPVDLDKLYDEPNIWNNQTDFLFTPTESGVLTIWSQDAVMHVYAALNTDGSDVDYETQISSFGYASYTYEGISFSKRTTSNVEAGKKNTISWAERGLAKTSSSCLPCRPALKSSNW